MAIALPIVSSMIASCSACTETINNTDMNHSVEENHSINMGQIARIQHIVPYNIVNTKNLQNKSISIVRSPVSYQTTRSNKFTKNSAKSLRRRGSLFQPGRTNCIQRKNR